MDPWSTTWTEMLGDTFVDDVDLHASDSTPCDTSEASNNSLDADLENLLAEAEVEAAERAQGGAVTPAEAAGAGGFVCRSSGGAGGGAEPPPVPGTNEPPPATDPERRAGNDPWWDLLMLGEIPDTNHRMLRHAPAREAPADLFTRLVYGPDAGARGGGPAAAVAANGQLPQGAPAAAGAES